MLVDGDQQRHLADGDFRIQRNRQRQGELHGEPELELDVAQQLVDRRRQDRHRQRECTALAVLSAHAAAAHANWSRATRSATARPIPVRDPVKDDLASEVDSENSSSSFREEPRLRLRDEAARCCASRVYTIL